MGSSGMVGQKIIPFVGVVNNVITNDIIFYEPLKGNRDGALFVALNLETVNDRAERLGVQATDLTENISASLIGALMTASTPMLLDNNFDGTGETRLRRQQSNIYNNLLTNSARTATTETVDQDNFNWRGMHAILNVTSITGSPSITFRLQGKDETLNVYYDLLVSSAIATPGVNVFKLYPGIAPIANNAASDILPRIWRIQIEHANSDSITYGVSANLVV